MGTAGGWKEVMNDLGAGTIGGVAGIVAGHPLDTIKVRLQTTKSTARFPVVSCAIDIFKREGISGLYKGLLSPCVSNGPINAIVFSVHGYASRFFDKKAADAGKDSWLRKHEDVKHFLSGFCAGFLQSLVASPAEVVKIKLQVDADSQMKDSTKALQLYRRYGLKNGLFQGFWLTALRDSPAFGFYFYTYHVMNGFLTKATGGDQSPGVKWSKNLLAGGCAGIASWVFLHPIDLIKTCAQSLPPDSTETTMSLIRKGYRTGGASFFFQGITATALRAFPVSAVTFVVYEAIMEQLVEELDEDAVHLQ